jgi:hypothetical protein
VTELSPAELDAGLEKLSQRLKTSRADYLEALFDLVPFVEQHARAGDEDARRLFEVVERARTRMVSENLLIQTEFGLE